jgi:hypothetical protein
MRLGFHDIKKLFIQIVVRPPYRIHPMRPPSGGPEASEAAPVGFNSIFNLSLCQFIREMKKTPTRAMVSTSAFLYSRI